MISINESGVVFGRFSSDALYKIEHSQGHKNLGDGFKMVEFTYLNNQDLFVIEAKSSIPKPTSQPDYDNYWNEILEKFENALLLQMMGYLKRNQFAEEELPANHKNIEWKHTTIKLRLVIPPIPNKYLPSITEIFRKKMKKVKKLWCIKDVDIFVINEEKAHDEGLLISES